MVCQRRNEITSESDMQDVFLVSIFDALGASSALSRYFIEISGSLTKYECMGVCVNSLSALQPCTENNNRLCIPLHLSFVPFSFSHSIRYRVYLNLHFQHSHTHEVSIKSVIISIVSFTQPFCVFPGNNPSTTVSNASLEFKMTQLKALSIQIFITIHWIKRITSWEVGCLE